MRLIEKKTDAWSRPHWEGKKQNFTVIIDQRGDFSWYFYLSHSKKDLNYNSLWDQLSYATLEEAQSAAEAWIDSNA